MKTMTKIMGAGLLMMTATGLQADQVILDDLIVDGSSCIGQDCVNGESFGFDTIRIKENNLRIKAQDTSNSASFPTRDWQITFNESANGGLNKFSIDDIDGGRTPLTIEAGAPSHSLYVDDGGRVGFGTSTPVVDLHVKSGNTPTLRLEQDGSSGFSAQTWDVAGNETNFFIRDASNGSTLPIRLRPGAPTSSIDIAASGDIGMGTSSPNAALHVKRNQPGFKYGLHLDNANAGATGVAYRMTDNTLSIDTNNIGGEYRINFDDGDNQELTLDTDGNLTIDGTITTATQTLPDYVFESGYKLMPLPVLKDFIAEEKHLPGIPSAKQVLGENKGQYNMTKMQISLLEKVEELTLYTLEQQAKIDALEAVIKKLDL